MTHDQPLRASTLAGRPAWASPLVGRDRLVAAVTERVRQAARLVTLSGPGGVGKTRVAFEAAAQLDADFPDGVVLVSLDAAHERSSLAEGVAVALGLRVHGDADATVLTALSARGTLLLLDGAEATDDVAAFVLRVLARAPSVSMLVTGRAPLNLSGEEVVPVRPLDVPSTNELPDLQASPAAALFVERARRADPTFTLTTDNAAAVHEIVQALGGLPLALELAAARMRLLSLAGLRDRLGLALLGGGARDVPERHRTLRATLAWSVRLLSRDAQALFSLTALFPDSFTLAALEAVAARDVLDDLGVLLDHGLVVRATADRFRLLAPVREFALERADASEDVDARFAEHYRTYAREARTATRTDAQSTWFGRIALDLPNFNVALDRSVRRSRADVAADLCDGLWFYWWTFQPAEGRRWAERISSLDTLSSEDLGRVLLVSASMAYVQGAYDAAYDKAREAWRHLPAEATLDRVRALLLRGVSASLRGERGEARETLSEAARLASEATDAWSVGVTRTALGRLALDEGDRAAAMEHLAVGLQHYRAGGNWSSAGYTASLLAALVLDDGRPRDALALLREAVRWAVVGPERSATPYNLAGLAAAPPVDRGVAAYGLAGVAAVLARHDPAAAARLWGAARHLWTSVGVTPVPSHVALHHPHLERARRRLGAEAYDREGEIGRTLPLDAAASLALNASVPDAVGASPRSAALTDLTPREQQVLRLLTEGLTNPQIAARLGVGVTTVHSHVRTVFSKLGVSTRAAAVRAALQREAP